MTHTRFPGVPLQPLEHLSFVIACKSIVFLIITVVLRYILKFFNAIRRQDGFYKQVQNHIILFLIISLDFVNRFFFLGLLFGFSIICLIITLDILLKPVSLIYIV